MKYTIDLTSLIRYIRPMSKKTAKTRVSTKQRLMKLYGEIDMLRERLVLSQSELFKATKNTNVLHEYAMITDSVVRLSNKVASILK